MTRSTKISTLAAALVISFFSIYAVVVTTFNTGNMTSQPVNVTLNMASGAQSFVNVPPGQNVATTLNGDQVSSMTIYGAMVPAGVNAIVPNPSGGTVTVMWSVIKNADGSTSVVGGTIDPNVAS
ncbi:MAG: hypothetical protein Q8922_09445 [Bacteroidota bacterium]|nr:hypothetical protein [Bacteroidota bacterium]MDP4234416.1 hypothetical protein [Bacteroidota bacterium]MDP4243982.1 hypothetical protein [Bacteroidota bacterium]MDP4288148.1 hypothetical protein [Bacteroidota bacterium]